MVKSHYSEKELQTRAIEALQRLFDRSPEIEIGEVESEAWIAPDRGMDFLVSVSIFGRPYKLVCEVKSDGQPRHVRFAALQLRDYVNRINSAAKPILIAPFLSEKSRAICVEHGVGYLDLYGNALFQAPGILIDTSVADRPPPERRDLRSLFRPKAAHVLRVMLRNPKRAWRITELADAANASIGHVSRIRKVLLNREWAQKRENGVALADPDALMDSWRDVYRRPAGDIIKFYTSLHGPAFDNAAKNVFSLQSSEQSAVFASFSAARRLAPYLRTGTEYFYADEKGMARIADALRTSSVEKGENVEVLILKDRNILEDTIEPSSGVICTSPVQTYLDLTISGERGTESADHLRRETLTWR